jgi:type I restriction enzyme S subunit
MPEGSVPILSVASLIGDKEASAFIETDDIDQLGALISRPGDLLIAIEGGSVGDSFFVTPTLPLFVPSQQAVTVRVMEPSTLLPEYLAAWVSSPVGRQQLLRLARGGGIQRIALSDLLKLSVPMPPMDVQRNIGDRLAGLSEAIAEHRKVLDALNELRELELTWLFRDEGTTSPAPANSSGPRR